MQAELAGKDQIISDQRKEILALKSKLTEQAADAARQLVCAARHDSVVFVGVETLEERNAVGVAIATYCDELDELLDV